MIKRARFRLKFHIADWTGPRWCLGSRLRSSLSGGKEIPFLHSPCPLSVHSLPLFHIDTITTDDDDDGGGGGGGW